MQRQKLQNTPYEILEVKSTATIKEIKQVYRKLAVKWHPDKPHNHSTYTKVQAEEMFKKIFDAYSVLCDPVQRKRLDEESSTNISEEKGGKLVPLSVSRNKASTFSVKSVRGIYTLFPSKDDHAHNFSIVVTNTIKSPYMWPIKDEIFPDRYFTGDFPLHSTRQYQVPRMERLESVWSTLRRIIDNAITTRNINIIKILDPSSPDLVLLTPSLVAMVDQLTTWSIQAIKGWVNCTEKEEYQELEKSILALENNPVLRNKR
jgi:hypothetical protein